MTVKPLINAMRLFQSFTDLKSNISHFKQNFPICILVRCPSRSVLLEQLGMHIYLSTEKVFESKTSPNLFLMEQNIFRRRTSIII